MQQTKPFNLEHAKAGAPYACRNGSPATILKWDAKGSEFTLIGFVDRDGVGNDIPESWMAEGFVRATRERRNHDLVMLPLGEIDGKPVFVGDEVETNAFGDGWKRVTVCPSDNGFFTCRWPAPAKQYPVTALSGDELVKIYNDVNDTSEAGLVRTVNEALRHAIDNGQVIAASPAIQTLARAFDLASIDQIKGATEAIEAAMPERRAARDMAIARAVRNKAMGTVSSESQPYGLMQIMDLAAIIASVKDQ
jgi:hypothetical protein